MAAEIKHALGHDARLIPGSGGVFDIKVDTNVVYSKREENDQFPEASLVLERISKLNS